MSTAELDADLVVQACDSYLTARQARIDRESEQEIARWTGAKLWRWSRPMTREQARDYCSEELGLIRITGGRWASEVARLRDLAEMAKKCKTTVQVSSEHASCLASYFG